MGRWFSSRKNLRFTYVVTKAVKIIWSKEVTQNMRENWFDSKASLECMVWTYICSVRSCLSDYMLQAKISCPIWFFKMKIVSPLSCIIFKVPTWQSIQDLIAAELIAHPNASFFIHGILSFLIDYPYNTIARNKQ